MAAPSEKLAESLSVLKNIQNKNGSTVLKAGSLTRTHKERLLSNGFIYEVIKGWYIVRRPDERIGDSTSWFTSFWEFVAVYLNDKFGNNWCLSPEQSLSIHSGNYSVPLQLIVRSPKAHNNKIDLLYKTSFLCISSALPEKNEIVQVNGINIYSLPASLIACSPHYFKTKSTDVRTAFSVIRDSSDILPAILEGGHSRIAGRLVGAFRNIGRMRIADEILSTMKKAGYDIRETNPFESAIPFLFSTREVSPYENRIKLMWSQMRDVVIDNFPKPDGLPKSKDIEKYIKGIDDKYKEDAYNSLSIEGYRVTEELIEKVRTGKWNPDTNDKDREQRNALAARGYYLTFQAVKNSIRTILKGENSGKIAYRDHGAWYRELFSPSVSVGLLKPSDLSGYRNEQVFIKSSMHTPLKADALRDAMPALFDLLEKEREPAVRAILGHFIFVYIHPYMDGNGRLGRFLMNVMLSTGGYPWTIIPVTERDTYMASLERASVDQNIISFTRFVARQVKKDE